MGTAGQSAFFGCEGIPCSTASVDDSVVVGEEALGEMAFAPVKPYPFDRVQFGAVGRQMHERHVGGDRDGAPVVPAGAVEHQDGMGIVLDGIA